MGDACHAAFQPGAAEPQRSSRDGPEPLGPPEWLAVARSDELAVAGTRKHLEVRGRYVSLIRGRDGVLHCIDSVCYHTGGPLLVGDIEEVNGDECVRCPWHSYGVRLVDGARPYKKMDMGGGGKLVSVGWQVSERRQRVHPVEERDGEVRVLVSDVRADRHAEHVEYESDRWAYNASAAGNVHRPGASGPDGAKLKHKTY
jgi:nitrite reductase/ring-hydroxylating ferredoxin subunit